MARADYSKKDYIEIARVLSTVRDRAERARLAEHFVVLFRKDNAAFDPARFKAAVGQGKADYRKTLSSRVLERYGESVVHQLVRHYGASEPLAEEIVARHMQRISEMAQTGIRPTAAARELARYVR